MAFNQTAKDLFQRYKNKRQLDDYFANKAKLEQPSADFMNKIGASLPEQMSFKTPLDSALGTNGATVSQGSKLAEGLGKAGSVAGGVMSGLGAANDFANGDYVNGGLNAAKTIATFVPGGQVVAGAIQAGQMIKDLFAPDRSQEMMQKSMEEAIKSQQTSQNALAEKKAELDNTQQENNLKLQNQIQNMQQPQNEALVKGMVGQVTGGAAPVSSMPTNYAEESMPTLSEEDIAEQQLNLQQQQAPQTSIKQSLLDKFKSGLSDFSAGYQDNANTDFAHGDLMNGIVTGGAAPMQTSGNSFNLGATQNRKGAMARLGEAVGTGQRIMAHPLTQAAIAGMVSKAAGGNIDDIAKAAYQYGTNKAQADRYYQQVTGNTNRPFLNTYSATDVTNKRLEDALAQRQQQWMYEQMLKKAQQDYTNQFNREKFDYQKEKDKETNALRKEEIAARKEYYKNRGNSRQPAFDPTTVPGFYDDYQSYEEDQNIINDPELYNKEWDDMLHAMYGDRWFYSDKQRQDAKNELDKRMNKNKNDFYRKYRINPMKGKKA